MVTTKCESKRNFTQGAAEKGTGFWVSGCWGTVAFVMYQRVIWNHVVLGVKSGGTEYLLAYVVL